MTYKQDNEAVLDHTASTLVYLFGSPNPAHPALQNGSNRKAIMEAWVRGMVM
jgi:hypothetical protein